MNGFLVRPLLVTGAAGFVGSHLIDALIAAGERPVAIDTPRAWAASRNLAAQTGRFDEIALDLVTESIPPLLADRQPGTIFHVSGFASLPGSVRDPRRDFEKNAVATLNLLEAVRQERPQTGVVFTSSAAVYGEGGPIPFREEDPTVPMAPYAVSKLAAERYVDVYARVYGLRTASLRLFPNFGPRLRAHVVYDLMCKIRDNPREVVIEGNGQQVRDFVYVSNTVDALLLVAATAPLRGEVYNVGAGEAVTVTRLAEMICERMRVSRRFTNTEKVAPGVSHSWVANTARLQALGFVPRVRLAEGLTKTVQWFCGAAA